MPKKRTRKGKKSTCRNHPKSRAPRSRLALIGLPLALFFLLVAGAWLFTRHREPRDWVTPAEVKAEIIPRAGQSTSYGLPLSLENTRRFIAHYRPASLTARQRATIETALEDLKAPCCDDNPMATCCCSCNLAKSVWGLSAYLITEKGYDADHVRESASQWLRFIQSNYYVMRELEARGVDPSAYGLSYTAACYNGLCEVPFANGGCGGMKSLNI